MQTCYDATNKDRIGAFKSRNPQICLQNFGDELLLQWLIDGYMYLNEHELGLPTYCDELSISGCSWFEPNHNTKEDWLINVIPNDTRYNQVHKHHGWTHGYYNYNVRLIKTAMDSDWATYLESLGFSIPPFVVLFYVENPLCSAISVEYMGYYPIDKRKYISMPSPYPNSYSSSSVTGVPQTIVETVELSDQCLLSQKQFDLWMKISLMMSKQEAEWFNLGAARTPILKKHQVDIIRKEYQDVTLVDDLAMIDGALDKMLNKFKASFGGSNFIYV